MPVEDIVFDVREIPFSRRGAWLNLSPVLSQAIVADDVHLVSHQTRLHAVLRLVPVVDDARIATTVAATPSVLTWTADAGVIEACFTSTGTLRCRGRGPGLRLEDPVGVLTPFTGSYLVRDPAAPDAVELTSYETGRRYRVTLLAGRLAVEGSETLGAHARAVTVTGADGWEVEVAEAESGSVHGAGATGFDDACREVAAEFAAYVDRLAPWRTEQTPAAALAAYVMWSATVRPAGFLARESVLMSMHWMDRVWSWDHCINALALAPGDLAAALDQWLVPFDHQTGTGALPDSVGHSEVLYNFVKPPIHGWALRELRRRAPQELPDHLLATIYRHLAGWTTFWLSERRAPGAVLPFYLHGNDSGWDNSTMFDRDRVIVAPDLAAFLVLQLDVLSELADELGHDGAAWRAERDAISAALLDQLWDGDSFCARSAFSGRASAVTSLLVTLPVVLGERLPPDVVAALAIRIAGFVTEHGPATELLGSPEYEDDGYWRGPVWAPSTLLVEDGLRRAGEEQLADRISAGFRRACERSGFAENFDARTGAGLRDRAYTWTASAYLVLAADAVRRGIGD